VKTDFVQAVPITVLPPEPASGLHAGEYAALELARQRTLPLLIDERLGRQAATQRGIAAIGSAGLLLSGWRQNLLTSQEVTSAVQALYAAHRINRRLLQELLAIIQSH
jgi:uncharacterized protein